VLRTRRTNNDPKGEHGDRQTVACTRSTSEAGNRSNPGGQEDLPRDVARRTGFLELFRRLVPRPTRRSRFATMHGAPSRRTAATFTARERYNDSAVPGGLGVGDRRGQEPTGLPGAQVAGDPQDRSKRCAGADAFGSHWLLQARAREIAASSALRSLISARKKLVGQRVTVENQIRGLAVVFGVRLPRALAAAFIDNALRASEGIAGLSAAMRGLIAARTGVMTAVAAIDADMRRMTRAFAACRRLMT
jgi:hypothetical protein